MLRHRIHYIFDNKAEIKI